MIDTGLRTILIYFVILLVIRLMGKRELAQLSPFDFVVSIIIAELAALPMEQQGIPLPQAIFPIIIMAFLEIAVSYLAMRSIKARSLIYGHPTVVIADGSIIDKNMRKLRYNINDLLAQLRDKGYFDLRDVQYAIVEVPGTLSVVPKRSEKNIEDKNENVPPLPIPLIIDGKIIDRNLKIIDKDVNWLKTLLKEKNLSNEQVFFLTYSDIKGIYLSKSGIAENPKAIHLKSYDHK